MSKRRLARENCLQSLYSSDVAKLQPASVLASFQMEDFATEARVFDFYKTLYSTTVSNIAKIDDIIKKTSLNWEMDRMPAIDRSILRMAVCEMMILSDAPVAVIIDDSFYFDDTETTEKSGKFVNGVLDGIARQNNLVK